METVFHEEKKWDLLDRNDALAEIKVIRVDCYIITDMRLWAGHYQGESWYKLDDFPHEHEVSVIREYMTGAELSRYAVNAADEWSTRCGNIVSHFVLEQEKAI